MCISKSFGWIHCNIRVNIIFFFVAFARWNFLLFLTLKTITNFSGQMGQLHAYVMLQMNPPFVYSGYRRGKGDRNFITFSINSRAK